MLAIAVSCIMPPVVVPYAVEKYLNYQERNPTLILFRMSQKKLDTYLFCFYFAFFICLCMHVNVTGWDV